MYCSNCHKTYDIDELPRFIETSECFGNIGSTEYIEAICTVCGCDLTEGEEE